MSFKKIITAWQQAAIDLHIKVQSPYILTTANNNEIMFELLIEDFGSALGTLIISTDNMIEFNTGKQYGYYCSALNPYNYSTYEREHFIDTLNDWGYFGDKSKKPVWYKGK